MDRDPIDTEIELQTERRARSVPPTLASRGYTISLPPDPRALPRPLSPSRKDGHYTSKRETEIELSQKSALKSAQATEVSEQRLADEEMNTYTQALHLTKKKILEAQEDVKNARDMSEKAKSELLTLEFKRGNASQELERLTNDIVRKKGQMSALDAELHVKIEEVKNMRSVGVTREDCLEVKAVKDENASLKSKVRNVEGLELERDELVRQLEAAKEDLFREQKVSRAKMDELQEEIDTMSAKLDETETSWRNDQVQMGKLEASFKRVEREKNELIQEKNREYEQLKATCTEESNECQGRLQKELKDIDQEVQTLRTKVSDLQLENAVKDAVEDKLRSEINDIGSVLDRERQERHKASSEQKKVLQHLKKETAAAVLRLQESMFLEKEKALDEMKEELEIVRRETGARSEEKLIQVLGEHSYQMAEKDSEIARIEDDLRRLESYKQVELEEHIRDAVRIERDMADLQKDWQLRQDQEVEKRRSNEMTAMIDKEKQTNQELLTDLTNLRKEVDDHKRHQRDANKDKLVAVARAKEQMKEQGNAEIERIKFNLKQEHLSEMDRLKEKIHIHDQEVARLKSEIDNLAERERHASKMLELTERSLITEIQKECQRVCSSLGVTARTLHSSSLNSLHLDTSDGRSSPSLKSRPAVISAMASLRACMEDIQYHISEIQQEQEALRMVVKTVRKEKEEAIDNCRLEMDRKRILDLEKLKEKLLKEHVSEMSNVIQDCAEANTQLKTNSQILQRYGDAALLEALQAKDAEMHTVQASLNKWQGEMEEKFNTQLQLQIAKEREKYQALQHHSTREQNRVTDLQKREIDRLEKEVQRLATGNPYDSNRYTTSSPSPRREPSPATHVPASLPPPASSPSSLKSSQQHLQNRIEQLQMENAALRKQRLLNSRHISWSTSSLTKPTPERPLSSRGRPMSPSRDMTGTQRIDDRSRHGEEDIDKQGWRGRHGEEDTQKVDDRAKLNQKMMNNKMEEMMKLQNTLIIQNQELHDLERSYNDLQKYYHSRPGSPTRNLNTTM